MQAYVYVRAVSCCHSYTVRIVFVTCVLCVGMLCACWSIRCRIIVFWVCYHWIHLLWLGFEYTASRRAYRIYCVSAYTSPLRRDAPVARIVLRPTQVHCVAMRLSHLLCFGLHEFIVSRCACRTYCAWAYMSSLYRGSPTVPIVFRPT